LEQADWIWNRLRPLYNRIAAEVGGKGLSRVINGTDPMLVKPEFRGVSENYEPDVWRSLMREIQPQDVFADVGVFIGLYTIAVAKRLGRAGRVVAFEPDPNNYLVAAEHIRLNKIQDRVELIQAAASRYNGKVSFHLQADTSHIAAESDADTYTVESVTLDRVFDGKRLDVLKIDVEGHEEMVLRGAEKLLHDSARKPRAIYIEVHPYAWPALHASSESLLSFLAECGYEASMIDGQKAERIDRYGEIIARNKMK
jgi:FkbM family methyltransferase